MAIVNPTAPGTWLQLRAAAESLVILVAMIVVFGAAAYSTGSLYGRSGLISIVAGFAVVVAALFLLGGLRFGYLR